MLESFLSLSRGNPANFARFEIGKELDIIQQHRGKYPVIRLDFQNWKGQTWEAMLRNVWIDLRRLVSILDLSENEIPFFDTKSFKLEEASSYWQVVKEIMIILRKKNKRLFY
jgi:hypothetical protein